MNKLVFLICILLSTHFLGYSQDSSPHDDEALLHKQHTTVGDATIARQKSGAPRRKNS